MKAGKLLFAVFVVSLVAGCGVWDAIVNPDPDEVMLKGEKGASCEVNADCRSNSCVFPGVCE